MLLFPTIRSTPKPAQIAKERLRYVLSRERMFGRPPIDTRPVCFEETPKGSAIMLSYAEWSSVLADLIDQLQQADSRIFLPDTQVYLEKQNWVISPAQSEELRQILAVYGLELVSESLSPTPSTPDENLDFLSAEAFDPSVIQSTSDFPFPHLT